MECNANSLLCILDLYKTEFPNSFDELDSILKTFIGSNYAPDLFEVMMRIVDDSDLLFDDDDDKLCAVVGLNAMYSWRRYKKIYKIDRDLIKLLYKQDISNMPIESEFLKNLPFDGMCIYLEGIHSEANAYVFVNLGYIEEEDIHCLSFSLIVDDGYDTFKQFKKSNLGIILPAFCNIPLIDNKTVSECIQMGVKYSTMSLKETKIIASRCLNALMYIMSINADVQESPTTKNTFKPSTSGVIHDKFREIEMLDVGVRIGNTIRKRKTQDNRQQNDGTRENRSGSKSTKCSHVRCGHWHHYWTGPRNDPSQRKRTLKWIHPILINTTMEESKDVTINLVKE